MNEFNKEYRYKRQDSYDINKYNLLYFDFDGLKKKVYENVNFSIFTDDYCNADCKFCVAQLRFENRGQLYEKCKIDNDEEYMNRLREVLIKIRPINPSISITGGEPTRCKRLVQILELINELGFRKRTITTNGSCLLHEVKGKTILQHLIDNNFSHLNISRTHYSEEVNKKIMRFNDGEYCSNDDISKIVKQALANNLRPRMSCLLLKEGIHTIDDILNYLEFYSKLGLDNIIFRELMDFDKNNMLNIEKMRYCEENKIKLNDIWEDFDKEESLIPYKNILGYYYYVEIYKYKNVDCVSESANLMKLYEEKAKNTDIVYEMVFHPNGNLNGSWVDNEDILLKYKSEK